MNGGEHDDGDAGVVGAELIEEAEAVGMGHHDVGQDEVVGWVFAEMVKGLLGAFGHGGVIAEVSEHRGYDAADGCFVVDDEDFLVRHWLEAPLRGRAFFVIGEDESVFNWADFFVRDGEERWPFLLGVLEKCVRKARWFVVS